jgi:hypothetical protein
MKDLEMSEKEMKPAAKRSASKTLKHELKGI